MQTVADVETIVVDNGSTDGSIEMLQAEFSGPGKALVRVIRNSHNRGFCAANNQGIDSARSQFVALLNNDAEASPDWLRELLTAFDSRPEVGMAASKVLVYEDPSRIDKVGHLIYPDGQNRGRGTGERDHGQYQRVEETAWPDGCACMYRRAMLDEIGGFDEDLFAYADDAELGLRAQIAGWKCLYIPTAVVRHHRGATLGVRSTARLELIERNRVLLAAKLFPIGLLFLNPFYYLLRLAAGAVAASRGKGEVGRYPSKLAVAWSLLRADAAALLMTPRMLAKRKHLVRRISNKELYALLKRYRIPLRNLTEDAI
jgi:GT2 family glycosyltransferase